MNKEKQVIVNKIRSENNELVEDNLKKKDEVEHSDRLKNNNNSFSGHNIKFNQKLQVSAQDNLIFGPNIDINQIILNRTLFIIKKKFEIYEKELK